MDRTETSIANMAADFLDSSIINNINDQYGTAAIYRRNYQEAVETVLTEFIWNGTKSRAILNPVTLPIELDSTDYQNAYAWPSDCLAPIDINGRPIDDLHWEVETISILDAHGVVVGKQHILFCDFDGTIVLRYQSFIEPRDMSAHCAKAVALELAMRCQGNLKNSTTSMEQLRDMYAETTKGTPKRVGGHQVDSRQNRPRPRTDIMSTGDKARAGYNL